MRCQRARRSRPCGRRWSASSSNSSSSSASAGDHRSCALQRAHVVAVLFASGVARVLMALPVRTARSAAVPRAASQNVGIARARLCPHTGVGHARGTRASARLQRQTKQQQQKGAKGAVHETTRNRMSTTRQADTQRARPTRSTTATTAGPLGCNTRTAAAVGGDTPRRSSAPLTHSRRVSAPLRRTLCRATPDPCGSDQTLTR